MEQTASIASEMLANPSKELQDVLNDPRTTDEARAAVKEVMPPAAAATIRDPSSTSNDASSNTNKAGEGRLQIVNEHQEFT